jgi:hypothetical protein
MRRASVRSYPHRSKGDRCPREIPLELCRGKYRQVRSHRVGLLTRTQYDTVSDRNAPDITDTISPLTITSLLSIGGFAGTFMPLPSRTTYKNYSNPSEELVDRLINYPSEKTVEVNFNLASKMLWSTFVADSLRSTNNQSRIYIVPNEEPPGASPVASTSSSNTPTP